MPLRYHQDGSLPAPGEIFVFGSNLAGRHGAGAAHVAARLFGAQYGIGCGPTGRAYAIATKDRKLQILSLEVIATQVELFLAHAVANSDSQFFVTRVGCGLAGYADSQIAPMFTGAPENCSFASTWREHLDPVPNWAPDHAHAIGAVE
jgi:hypothetical protein